MKKTKIRFTTDTKVMVGINASEDSQWVLLAFGEDITPLTAQDANKLADALKLAATKVKKEEE